jgi:iron complex outermembrane recepter protein
VPKVTLRWRPTDDMTYYASWAAAAKPSGISALTGGPGSFDPVGNAFQREERDVYEIGAKTQWLDRRLTVNGAIFYDDYSGKQISTQIILPSGLVAPRTINGGDAEVYGVEFDIDAQLSETLSASLGYTFLHTEWKEFIQNTRSVNQIALGGNCTLQIITIPDGTDAGTVPDARTNCLVDLSGKELTFAPKHSFVGNLTYVRPLSDTLDLFLQGDLQYQSKRYVNDANTLALDSYWMANMRGGVQNDRWSAILYIDNLFDDDTIKSGLDNIDTNYVASAGIPNGARALLPDKRAVGLRVGFNFGGD